MNSMPIKKQLVTDEDGRPTAVLITIEEWRRIEAVLGRSETATFDVMNFAGLIELGEEPLAYQRSIRQEWE